VRVLITAGGTEEPLDGVRRLTNTSTGATGLALANAFADGGAEVVLLHAERVPVDNLPVETLSFLTFDDLAGALEDMLSKREFDAVIHLAAVSDYRLASVEVEGRAVDVAGQGKIGSGHELLLRLTPNPKLIDSLRQWSRNPDLVVVGFKLTDDPDPVARKARVDALLDRGAADLVVHNDIREIDSERHQAAIHSQAGLLTETRNKNELASTLLRQLASGELS
jgi:phosphopantothenoylcysteine decarboxylase/phosphopantothenate--cysteine ligase